MLQHVAHRVQHAGNLPVPVPVPLLIPLVRSLRFLLLLLAAARRSAGLVLLQALATIFVILFMPSYPKDVIVDFRKLDEAALKKILTFYKYTPDASVQSLEDLAAVVAHLFRMNPVVDNDVVDHFAHLGHTPSSDQPEQPSKRSRHTEYRSREIPDFEVAKQGEQVAAKVLSSNENGSWILGNVLDFDPSTNTYDIQDEDDTHRIMTLGLHEVKRLEDTTAHFRKGDTVLCVFPDTTSFYRAVVARNPKAPTHGNSSWELVVRFEDDEDETGVAPPRRVPARFVLRRADVEDEEED